MFWRRALSSSKRHPDFPFTTGFRAVLATISIVLLTGSAAWLTHVVTCLIEGRWGFLIAGAIAFPIAVVHGIMIWFGFAG